MAPELTEPAPDTACRHQANPNHYSVLGRSLWLELIVHSGFEVVESVEIGFDLQVGRDLYWGFLARRV